MKRFFFVFIFVFIFISVPAVYAKANIKIVSLSPQLTEVLYSIGAGSDIVGVTKYCDCHGEKKTVVGDVNVSYETVVKLKPDIIFVEKSKDDIPYKRLTSLGFRVERENFTDCKAFFSSVRHIALVLGRTKRAEYLLQNMKKKLKKLGEKADAVKNKKTVFVEVWDKPLVSAGKSSFISEMINYAGGVNIAENFSQPYPTLSYEYCLKKNPDVILIMTSEKVPAVWKELKAVKRGSCFFLDRDSFSRMGFDMPDKAEKLYKMIYSSDTYPPVKIK